MYCSKRKGSYYFHPGAELAVSGRVTDQLSGSKSRDSPLCSTLEAAGEQCWNLEELWLEGWPWQINDNAHDIRCPTLLSFMYMYVFWDQIWNHMGKRMLRKPVPAILSQQSVKIPQCSLLQSSENVTIDSLVHTHNRAHSVKLSFGVALSSPSSVPMASCLNSLPGLVFSLQFMPWGIMQSVPGFRA